MKRTLSLLIISLLTLCSKAQDIYVGSFYITSTDEEATLADGKNKWSARMPYIVDMLKFEQPDVLGLQSFTSSQFSALTIRLTTHAAAGDILYNKTTVLLDTCGTVEGLAEGCSCSWAKMQKDGRDFFVFNFCLTPDGSATAATRIRTALTALNPDGLPCFLMGYLGVSEGKSAYTRLSSRYNDCYQAAPVVSAEYGTVSNFDLEANHDSSRFDFIFASKNISLKAYGQLQYGYFTKETDGTYKRRQLSAHHPVMVKATLPQ